MESPFACFLLRMAVAPVLALVALRAASPAQASPDPPPFAKIDSTFLRLIDEGHVVGAQVVIGTGGEESFAGAYGTLAPGDPRPVDGDTLFLIGSTSKPFASACVMALVEDPEVALHLGDPIDRWLPAFADAPLAGGGKARRAPTVKELLCHRGGIYSQKQKMTPRQTSLIRDFRRDLETAVDAIATQPLGTQPGEMYSYSGAGYCVLGRVAEIASGQAFEEALQERICKPLGLTRTSYFPTPGDHAIAVGFEATQAPHALGKNHRLPLIGGSLYSTAGEMAVFARAIHAAAAKPGPGRFLMAQSVETMATRPFPDQSYGLGWALGFDDSEKKNANRLSHSGALLSYRALIRVNLTDGNHVTAVWTLRSGQSDAVTRKAIHDAINTEMRS